MVQTPALSFLLNIKQIDAHWEKVVWINQIYYSHTHTHTHTQPWITPGHAPCCRDKEINIKQLTNPCTPCWATFCYGPEAEVGGASVQTHWTP